MISCQNAVCGCNKAGKCILKDCKIDDEGKCESFRYSNYKDTIGERLYEIEDRLGVDNQDLGELLGVTGALISMWKSNKRAPMTKYILRICGELNISADWLLFGRGDMYADSRGEN